MMTRMLAIVALFLLSCPTWAEDPPDPANGQLIAVGGLERAGVETACFRCHGVNGEGDGSGAFPRLAGLAAPYLEKQMQDYAQGSRPNEIMSPIARALNSSEWADVAAWYAGLETPYPPRPEADPMLIQRGGLISASGSEEAGIQACITCHGPSGFGLPPNFPQLAGQYAAYLELQLRLWKQGVRQNDPVGMMSDIAKRLTEEEIRAVSLYYESVRPPADPPDPAGGPP